jgi:hypothetical protein
MRTTFIALTLSAASSLAAQARVTLPAGLDSHDGAGLLTLPGVGGPGRLQAIYGPSLLGSLRGRLLTSVELRRDSGRFALASGDVRLRVTLGEVVTLDALAASAVFDANLGNRGTLVFDGTVNLPASAQPAQRQAAAWSAVEAIELPFASAVAYSSIGSLVMQIDGQPGPQPTDFWPVDVETGGFAGTVSYRGRACGPIAARVVRTGDVGEQWLRPGSTVRFLNLAPAGSASVMLLGVSAFAQGIDLSPFGAPGCELWLDPAVIVPTMVRSVSGTHVPAAANTNLQLPADAGVLGASLYAQWVNVHGTSMSTTNAVRAQVSGVFPALDATTISAAGATPATGTVQTGRAIVARFGAQ